MAQKYSLLLGLTSREDTPGKEWTYIGRVRYGGEEFRMVGKGPNPLEAYESLMQGIKLQLEGRGWPDLR